MNADVEADQLNSLLLENGMEPLGQETADRFAAYLELLLKWNRQLNLTAIRTPVEIQKRHFVESIFTARSLPAGIETLLDYGSGAGFPGMPIACCRAEISVTLAESQGKKAAFLREAVRSLGISVAVYHGRCESLSARGFGAVTMRAVEKMGAAIQVADRLVRPDGWMVLMLGAADAERYCDEFDYRWLAPLQLPYSENRVLLMGQHKK